MNRRLRRAVALSLLALGFLGLLCTGSGVWQGTPWPWLVVLALAVGCQVAGDHYDQRQRLARRTARRMQALEEDVARERRKAIEATAALRERIDAVGTPEGMKAFREVVQAMANDLKPIKEEWESIRTAGGLRSLMRR